MYTDVKMNTPIATRTILSSSPTVRMFVKMKMETDAIFSLLSLSLLSFNFCRKK
jgi:hypothetical protein